MTRIAPTPHEPVVIGPRRVLTDAERMEIHERQDRRCPGCSVTLARVAVEYDHIDPHWISGNEDLSNFRALCVPCHKAKTKADKGDIAKAKRRQSMLVGAERKPSRLKSRNEWPKGKRLQSKGFGK